MDTLLKHPLISHLLPLSGVVLSLYPCYFQLRYKHRLDHTYQASPTLCCGITFVRFTLQLAEIALFYV